MVFQDNLKFRKMLEIKNWNTKIGWEKNECCRHKDKGSSVEARQRTERIRGLKRADTIFRDKIGAFVVGL